MPYAHSFVFYLREFETKQRGNLNPHIEKIRQIASSSIVMVKRGTQSSADFFSDFQIEENDELIIVGSDDTINKFRTYFC